jgi:hypothetical protein
MRPAGAYEYAAPVPAAALQEGPHEFVITAFRGGAATTFPGGVPRKPWDWDYFSRAAWPLDVIGATTPLQLFRPDADATQLAFSRIGDAGRRGLFRVGLSPVTGQPIFHLELPAKASGPSGDDYTASLVIRDRIAARQETIASADGLRLRLRGLGPRQTLHVTLMEDDGTSWSATVTVDSTWAEHAVPLAAFRPGRGVLLPQGFPGEWSYWVGPAAGRGGPGDRLRLDRVERLQLSLRHEAGAVTPGGPYGVEVEWVRMGFGSQTGSR